ncbi:MAG: helix-turn-helix domain-containing protein [Pseudomonadota bacterium]
MEILENLGRRIREKRGAQGIRAAAKDIGISHATLSRVERGFLPDLENYKKLCQWLGVEIESSLASQSKQPASIANVHFRKKNTTSAETAQALAELILAAQNALLAEEHREGN